MPGDLFIALKGTSENGHDYVSQALAKGAVAAIVCEAIDGFDVSEQRLVHVTDTLEALRLMAKQARERAPAKIIGVTGSAGKTSVVHALRQAFERIDSTHSSVKSFNNHVGVPLSLARMPRETRYGIFELGMSAAGEIRENAELVQSDIAIVTTVGAAHTAQFADVAAVARAKAEIFEFMAEDGTAIINVDHGHADILVDSAKAAGRRVLTVSVTGEGDVKPLRMTEHADCTCLTADVAGTPITFKVAQPGREWVMNSLLLLTAVKAAGADLSHAALALAGLEVEPGRGRVHQLAFSHGACTLIDDSYNANPMSLRAALRRLALAPISKYGRRIAVLGDMNELGDASEEIHLALAEDLARFNVSEVIAFGPMMAAAAKKAGLALEQWTSTEGAAKALAAHVRDGDAVMVKGANSTRLTSLVDDLIEIGKAEFGGNGPDKEAFHVL